MYVKQIQALDVPIEAQPQDEPRSASVVRCHDCSKRLAAKSKGYAHFAEKLREWFQRDDGRWLCPRCVVDRKSKGSLRWLTGDAKEAKTLLKQLGEMGL